MTTKTTTGGRAAEGGREGRRRRKQGRGRKEGEGDRFRGGREGKRRIWQQVGGIEADPSAGTNLKNNSGKEKEGRDWHGYACRLQTDAVGGWRRISCSGGKYNLYNYGQTTNFFR